MRKLFFSQGELIYAQSNHPRERLSAVLLARKKITPHQFKIIEEKVKNTGEKVGKILVQEKMLEQSKLYNALRQHQMIIAITAFSLVSGEYDWTARIPEPPTTTSFNIKLQYIITKGMRRIRVLNSFVKNMSDRAPSPQKLNPKVAKFLTDNERLMFEDLKAHHNTPLKLLPEQLGIKPELFWRTAWLFYLLNILDFHEIEQKQKNKKPKKDLNDISGILEKIRRGESILEESGEISDRNIEKEKGGTSEFPFELYDETGPYEITN